MSAGRAGALLPAESLHFVEADAPGRTARAERLLENLPGRIEAAGEREWLAPFFRKLDGDERVSIVALGGSVTASSYWRGGELPLNGASPREAELAAGWPALLESLLRRRWRGARVNVTNAAVGGSSAEFAAVCLDSLVDSAAQPVDLVIGRPCARAGS